MNPFFVTDFSISDSLKTVRKSVLIYETIIEVHYQISALEEIVDRIKEVDRNFVDLDNYSGGTKFSNLKDELEDLIKKWKIRKTKVVGESDIDKNAAEYEQDLIKYMSEFYKNATAYYQYERGRIEKEFKDIYLKQPLDPEYEPEGVVLSMPSKTVIMGIKEVLVELKEERFEEKPDLFDFFKVSSETKELVLVVTSYYEKWREKAVELIIPNVENYIEESQKNLQNYYNELAKKYHEKLSNLHDCKVKEKNNIASKLSEDERLLQADNEWLTKFKDQLIRIERG